MFVNLNNNYLFSLQQLFACVQARETKLQQETAAAKNKLRAVATKLERFENKSERVQQLRRTANTAEARASELGDEVSQLERKQRRQQARYCTCQCK